MPPPGFEGIGNPDAVPPVEARNGLAEGVTMDVFNRQARRGLNLAQTNPLEFRKQQSNQSWRNIQAAQNSIRSAVPPQFGENLPADRDPRSVLSGKRFNEIVDSLDDVKNLQNKDDSINPKLAGRYIYKESWKEKGQPVEGTTLFMVNITQAAEDATAIGVLLAQFLDRPDVTAALKRIQVALQRLACADPTNYTAYMVNQAQKNSPANQMVGYVGKLAATVGLGGAALLTGVMSIFGKKFSAAPFLYGGALIYMLNPDFFAGKDKQLIKESAALLNQPAFVYILAPRYHMQGREWGEALSTLITMKNSGDALLKKYDANTLTDEESKDLLEKLAPGERNPAKADVKKLLANKRGFLLLRNMMKDISSPEVKELIASYTREGAWTYARRPGQRPAASREGFTGLDQPNAPAGGNGGTGFENLGGEA